VTLSISDLRAQFQVVTIPVTLVCAGNRRKEQNVVQQSLGFSWGAGGVSTALFTGVYLADILEYVRPTKKAKHVIFEGCDDLPNGPYGTRSVETWCAYMRRILDLIICQPALELGTRQKQGDDDFVGHERTRVSHRNNRRSIVPHRSYMDTGSSLTMDIPFALWFRDKLGDVR